MSATNPRYKIKNKKICYFSWQLIILYLNAVLLLACKSRSLSAWNGNSLIIFLMILMLCKIINYQVEFFWFLEVCTKDFKVIIQVKRKYDRFVFISFSCWLLTSSLFIKLSSLRSLKKQKLTARQDWSIINNCFPRVY